MEESVTEEQPLMGVLFAVKLTVPVGDPPPLTVAVKVTAWPDTEGLRLEVTTVVVAVIGVSLRMRPQPGAKKFPVQSDVLPPA